MAANHSKEVELLWNISQSVVSKTYLKEVLNLIVTMTASVMGSKICSIMLLDEKKGELSIAATQALSPAYLNKPPVKLGESISGRVVKEKKPLIVADIIKDKMYRFPEIAKAEGIVSLASIPMVVGEKVIGVVNTYTAKPHNFTNEEIRLLQAVANQAAIAIETTMLREENLSVRQELEDRKIVEQAKALLIEQEGMKEADAYRLLQKTSRDKRKSMADVAQAILVFYSMANK
jgi:GAF domain-containing protein